MASVAGTPSIASRYGVCIRSFERLCNLVTLDDEFPTQISLLALQDELGRFRVWAGNVGAHREGRISLDHRLREASQIHKQVTELLSDLGRALQEGKAYIVESPWFPALLTEIQPLPLFRMRNGPPMSYHGLRILLFLRSKMVP